MFWNGGSSRVLDLNHFLLQVWNHKEADKLFCEEIDVGDDKPRPITSALRGHCTLEEMQDKKVSVVGNLKAAKIVGFFASNGCWTIRVFRFTGLTRDWSFSNSHNFFDSRDHSHFVQISNFLNSMIVLTQDLVEEHGQ